MRYWLAFCCLLTIAASAVADERFVAFDAVVQLLPSGEIEVTETIVVNAEGRDIRRGIYRDFPTRYKDRLNNNYVVDLTWLEVLRDGQPEPHHTERISNGERLYIGASDTYLDPGQYTYQIRYRTSRQIGFFDRYDEIYWNVTGNDWAFPIDRATATIELPQGVASSDLQIAAYTGPQGASGQDFRYEIVDDDTVFFESTQRLAPREGMTVAVGFPKGLITAPSDQQKLRWFFADNGIALAGLGGAVLLFFYYLLAWFKVGRDPAPGVVYPRYEAPQGYSPAALRFVWKMRYDKDCLTTAIVNMATRQQLSIDKHGKIYTLKQGTSKGDFSTGERAIWKRLFRDRATLELKQKHHARLRDAIKRQKAALVADYEGKYFVKNRKTFIPAVLLTLVVIAAMAIMGSGEQAGILLFMSIWLTFWSIACYALAMSVKTAWQQADGIFDGLGAMFVTLFALPFFVGEIAGIAALWAGAGGLATSAVLAIVAIHLLFMTIMRAPTLRGRELLDHIDGLRMYLGVAEKDDLERMQQPEQSIEQFEKFLPYAIALECAETWADKFTSLLDKAAASGELDRRSWYTGDLGRAAVGSAIASGLSSGLSRSVASSSTAPGSSSGSSGGGSSGGGGGGGGGGGW